MKKCYNFKQVGEKMIKGEYKNYYDHDYNYDDTKLPEYLKKLIENLISSEKKQDEIEYDMHFDILEMEAKSFLRHGKISEKDFNKLMRKYGWYDE